MSTSATPQAQKHILLRKSNTSTAQIVPLNTTQGNQTNAQAGKHTFAYLGTLIKPNKSRESVVIPAGKESLYFVNFRKIVSEILFSLSKIHVFLYVIYLFGAVFK